MNPTATTTRRRRPGAIARIATHPAIVPLLAATIVGLLLAITYVIARIVTGA